MSSEFSVLRQNSSFIAAWEKRALIAMARRMPSAISPDWLTGFGVFGAVIVIAGYCLSNFSVWYLWIANLGIVIHWLGDSLDGTLARVRKIERPKFGFFLDQTIDLVSNLLIAVGLGFSPWVRLDVALLMLCAYHMLSVYVLVSSLIKGEFRIDVAGFGPTEVRIGIIVINLTVMIFGAPKSKIVGISYTWCDAALITTFIGLIGLFIYQLITEARRIVD